MGKVLAILGLIALIVGGGMFYMQNRKGIDEYGLRQICEREGKRVGTTYEGKVDNRIRDMAYERCLEKHGLSK